MKRSSRSGLVTGVGFALALCLMQAGCIKYYKPGSPETLNVQTDFKIGHRYRTKVDLFVIDWDGGPYGYDYALFMSRQFGQLHGAGPALAPESIDEYRADPRKWKHIKGVLPAGSILRFVGVAMSDSPVAGATALAVGAVENGPLAGKRVSFEGASRDNTGYGGLRIDQGVMEEVTGNP